MTHLPTNPDIQSFAESGFWFAQKLFVDSNLEEAPKHFKRLRRVEYEKGDAQDIWDGDYRAALGNYEKEGS